jgi:hypothetical protein
MFINTTCLFSFDEKSIATTAPFMVNVFKDIGIPVSGKSDVCSLEFLGCNFRVASQFKRSRVKIL